MAKCKGCGIELLDGTVFCPYCGSQVQKDETKNIEILNDDNATPQSVSVASSITTERGPFKVFAIIGMVFGIIVLSLDGLSLLSLGIPLVSAYLAAFGLELALPGLIFSIIGMKSRKNHGKAIFGLIASIVCLVLSFILIFVAAFLFVQQGGTTDDIYGGYYF